MDLPTLSYLRSFLILLFVFIISSIILVIVRQVMKLFYATLISRVDNKLRLLSDAISFYDSWYFFFFWDYAFFFFNFLEWKADDVINNNHLYYTLSLMKTATLSNCLMSSYLLQFYYDLFLGYLVSSYIYVFLQLGLIRIILLELRYSMMRKSRRAVWYWCRVECL